MSGLKRKLNVVDELGGIIGEDTRENIHKKGLLHREIHVWFYTPKGEIIFQHRGKNKDTYPDLLDATVGGHVEIGESYEDAAMKEMEEETGIKTKIEKLIFVQITRHRSYDSATDKINNVIRKVFAYRFNENLSELKVEEGKSQGFEAWHFTDIFNASEKTKERFIPSIFEENIQNLFRKIKKLYLRI